MMSKKNTKRWEVYLFDAAHRTNPAEATFPIREKAEAYAVRLRRESERLGSLVQSHFPPCHCQHDSTLRSER